MIDDSRKRRWLEILGNAEIEFRVGDQKKAFTALCDLVALLIKEQPNTARFKPQPSQPIIDDPEPEQPAPAEKPKKPKRPQPTEAQLSHRCNRHPVDCCQCSPNQQDKCGVEPENRKAPA